MNIKEAKQELLQTIQVYTRKDSNGHYLLPSVRQRPILLIGPPGIGKTAIMEQADQRMWNSDWLLIQLHIIHARVLSVSLSL